MSVDGFASSPESSNTASLQKKSRAILQRVASPSHSKGAEDVAVGDEEDIATLVLVLALAHHRLVPLFANLLDQLVQPSRDILGTPEMWLADEVVDVNEPTGSGSVG